MENSAPPGADFDAHLYPDFHKSVAFRNEIGGDGARVKAPGWILQIVIFRRFNPGAADVKLRMRAAARQIFCERAKAQTKTPRPERGVLIFGRGTYPHERGGGWAAEE